MTKRRNQLDRRCMSRRPWWRCKWRREWEQLTIIRRSGTKRRDHSITQDIRLCAQRRFGCLKKLFNFLRGQKRGRDKSPEKGLFQKTTLIKLIHFPNNLENRVFSKKWDFDWNLHIESHFFRKPKWSVRSIRTTFMRY